MLLEKFLNRLLVMLTISFCFLWSGGASAMLVNYAYGGTVDSCPNTGIPPCGIILFEGDTVTGPFVVDVTDAMRGNGFDFTDVVSFEVMVGNFFAVTSDNSALVDGSVKLNGSGEVVGGFLIILATALPDAPPTEVILDFDNNQWLAQALIPNVPDPIFIASGAGSLKPVPIPGALYLFLPALLALGVTSRRGD